ncbi:hypothetical protein [Mucilaginibacter sp.]|uniref:hypothetical protein n=1 Tax=Mucilaginibacter sp. TaxID=1882438 RepID=UPI0035BBF6F4
MIVISLLSSVYSCTQKQKLVVQPISEEFNHEYLTGKGLNTDFYSTKDVMQYYQVSSYDDLTDNEVLTKLDSFAMASFLPGNIGHIQTITFLFYKKKMFVDYRDHLHESAREDENGHLIGYNDELLANITLERMKENPKKMSVRKLLYGKDNLKLMANDTILVR